MWNCLKSYKIYVYYRIKMRILFYHLKNKLSILEILGEFQNPQKFPTKILLPSVFSEMSSIYSAPSLH